MENFKKLTQYFLSKSKLISLDITKLTWPDNYLPGYFDYQSKITLMGHEFIGRGTAKDEEEAFIKSCVEALERFSSYNFNSSWAIAGHENIELAKQNSYAELSSIDKVLCHHFTKKRLSPINWKGLSEIHGKVLLKSLNKQKILLETYELTPNQDLKITLAIAYKPFQRKRMGFVAGFGADYDIEKAVIHAIIETLRNAILIFTTEVNAAKNELIPSSWNPRWHFWKAQEEEALAYFKKYLVTYQNKPIVLKPENISIKDAYFTELTGIRLILPDIPLFFVQAQSDKLLTPQFGEFSPDKKNIKRLEDFNGGPVKMDLSVPHFYG